MFEFLRTAYKIFYYFRSLPKTIYFNFKYFPMDIALKLPVMVSHRVYLSKTKGSVIVEGPIKLGMVTIGFTESWIFEKKLRSIWNVSGEVIFKGRADICAGATIKVDGKLILGKGCGINSKAQIICENLISFGDDVLISWETLVMDSDLHGYKIDGKVSNPPRPIVMGNHIWVGCRCTILKGTKIPDNTIIAASSLLAKEYQVGNCIIGGNPARLLRAGVEWDTWNYDEKFSKEDRVSAKSYCHEPPASQAGS